MEHPDKDLWAIGSYLINRIAHRYNRNVRGELKALGLTTLNARIVVSLRAFGQLTISELCVHAIAEQPTMSRALDRLERDGLVSRGVGETDGRSRLVRLTPAGERLRERIMPVLDEANDVLLEGLAPPERAELMSLLGRVLERIRKHPI